MTMMMMLFLQRLEGMAKKHKEHEPTAADDISPRESSNSHCHGCYCMGCYGMLGCEKAQAIHSLEHGRVEVSGKFEVDHIQTYSCNFIHDKGQTWTNRVWEIDPI